MQSPSFSFCLLLLCAVGVVVSQWTTCLNDCSGHGSCHDSVCQCTDPYTGDDCSIYNKTITSGKTYSGSAKQLEWLYYNIKIKSQTTMNWWLNRTSSSGDCDIWIQRNRFPTWHDYLASNTSTAHNLSLVVPSENGGTYFVGVYGYRACSYDIQVDLTAECPSDCNSHGDCYDGVCQCHKGFYGDACETAVTVMQANKVYSSKVYYQKWVYYSYTVPQVYDEIDWVLTKTGSASEDCDIYVRSDDVPTLWAWDMANVSLTTTKTVKQSEAIVGQTYYMGVYGFSTSKCHFNVELRTVSPSSPSDCPNQCSTHGKSCSDNVCVCESGYTGPECETKTDPVVLGQTYTGFVGDNAWNYYSIDGDQASALEISLNQTGASSGDPDLYVKAGDKPTRYYFDYVDITTSEQMLLTIANPEGNTWWIGIFGFHASDYRLRVDGTETCSCVNSHQGSCNKGSSICICNTGYAGDDCSNEVIALTSAVPVTNQFVTNNAWKYYSIQSSSTSAASLSVVETATQGQVWVFVSHDEPPTLANYQYSDKSSKSLHQVTYSTKSPVNGTVYIGVYGSPFIPEVTIDGTGTQAYFDLSCWVSTF